MPPKKKDEKNKDEVKRAAMKKDEKNKDEVKNVSMKKDEKNKNKDDAPMKAGKEKDAPPAGKETQAEAYAGPDADKRSEKNDTFGPDNRSIYKIAFPWMQDEDSSGPKKRARSPSGDESNKKRARDGDDVDKVRRRPFWRF